MVKFTNAQLKELDKHYLHPRNLVDLFEDSAKKWADRPAIGERNKASGRFEWITYRALAERVNNVRGGLAKLGLKKDEVVGVIVSNSVEWFVLENATHGLGGVFVPMYEKELEKVWKYIIKDSKIKYLFVRDQTIMNKVEDFPREIKSLKKVFVIHGEGENSLNSLEEKGRVVSKPPLKPHWNDTACVIYTSGTTGDPKGVMLTHGNLTHCSQSGYEIYPELNQDSVALSILPWAHSYAISAELHNFLQFGGSIGIMGSLDSLSKDFLDVRPTHLMCVPRVFNKIYNGIILTMNEEGGLKKKLFDATCAEAVRCRSGKKTLKMKILDKIVFAKIRARFGGRLIGSLTASAVMNTEISLFFKDLGVSVYDCYGLSETAPAITMNSPMHGNKIGSVGKILRDMHVKLDRTRVGHDSPDGEVVAYGAHVMKGYLNKPEQTAAIMVKDRWNGFPGIRTGDLGRFDEDGFLYITGRFKDEYKLSNGKYVHPESIEIDMKLLPHVANAFVWGDGKEYNVAIVVPDFETIRKDHTTKQWARLTPDEIVTDESFREFVSNEIKAHLKKSFGGYEVPQKYMIVSEDFTLENGLLTQTMKVKRKEVEKRYGKDLEALYRK